MLLTGSRQRGDQKSALGQYEDEDTTFMKVTSPGTYERQVYDDLQSSIDQWSRVKQ